MIVKVDIEKAYDTLGWKDILSTLAKMNFLTIGYFGFNLVFPLLVFPYLFMVDAPIY